MRRISIHPLVMLLVAAACMLVSSGGGADFGRYRQWSVALTTGDIFGIASDVGSPLGLPVTHWSPGPGMIYAMTGLALGDVVDPTVSAVVSGWLTTLALWWAFLHILRWAARDDLVLAGFGVGAAFLGTHVGFLSRTHASESLAICLVALLTLAVIKPLRGLVASNWLVGVATALLVMVRSQYAVYALPALVLQAARTFGRDDRLLAAADREPVSHSRRSCAVAALLIPLAMAAAQQAIFNRWMTGTVTASPYVFGGSEYHSVNWLSPLFGPVLTHSWHGLLAYHPLYSLCFLSAFTCLMRARSPRERLLWAGGIVAVAMNLWIQAAWHIWWLGTGTFGMRGMAPAAVVLVPALVRTLADADAAELDREANDDAARSRAGGGTRASGAALAWTALTVLACSWSFLLLVQGTTQFYTWSDLLTGQGSALTRLARAPWMVSAAVASVLAVGAAISVRRPGQRHRARVSGVSAGVLLVSGSMAYLCWAGWRGWSGGGGRLLLPGVLMLVLIGSIFVFWRLASSAARPRMTRGKEASLAVGAPDGSPFGDVAGMAVRMAITFVLIIGFALFARLALLTERRMASWDSPPRDYRFVAPFDVQSALTGLREYQRIDGFGDRKEALRNFLISQGASPPANR